MKKIDAILKKHGVSAVYLFGSGAIGATTPLSDIDIGVVLKDTLKLQNARVLYNALYELFAGIYPSKKIDIVFLQASPIPLQYNAIKRGKILFEDNPVDRANYEEYVTDMYLDFKPLMEYFDSISQARYAKI